MPNPLERLKLLIGQSSGDAQSRRDNTDDSEQSDCYLSHRSATSDLSPVNADSADQPTLGAAHYGLAELDVSATNATED